MTIIQSWIPLRDVDSYHYLSVMERQAMPQTVFESVISGMTIQDWFAVVFLLSMIILVLVWTSSIYGYIAALFLLIDPFFMFNVSPMLIDKNIIYMLAFAVCVLSSIALSWKYEIISHISVVILLSFYWEGWYVMAGLLLCYHSLKLAYYHKRWLPLVMFTNLIGIVSAFIVGNHLLTWEVAELRPAIFFMSPYYYVYIFGIIVTSIYLWKNPDNQKPYHMLLYITAFAFIIIFRMHTFFIVAFYMIAMPIILENVWRYRWYYGLGIALLSVMSYPMYMPPSVEEPWMRYSSTEYLASNYTCAYNDWGTGHILAYYSWPKTISCRGHPNDNCHPEGCFNFYQYQINRQTASNPTASSHSS